MRELVPEVVLALDLSQSVGWACGARGTRPSHGVIRLVAPEGSERQGAIFAACSDAIANLIALHSPDRVVMEAPLPAQAQTHAHTAEQQFGLAAVARLICYRRQLRIRSVTPDTARYSVLKRARFGGRDQAKAAVMSWCRAQGLNPATDDAGDALIILAHELGGLSWAPEALSA